MQRSICLARPVCTTLRVYYNINNKPFDLASGTPGTRILAGVGKALRQAWQPRARLGNVPATLFCFKFSRDTASDQMSAIYIGYIIFPSF